MLLRRLLVAQKLNLLVLIPLAAVLVLSVPVVNERIQEVNRSTRTAQLMHSAAGVGGLIEQVQREQLLAVSSLAAPGSSVSPVLAQMSAVDTELDNVSSDHGIHRNPDLDAALKSVAAFPRLRQQILSYTVSADTANRQYNACVKGLIDALGLWLPRDGSAGDLRQQNSLDALLRSDAASNSEEADLLAGLTGRATAASLAAAVSESDIRTVEEDRFQKLATPDQARLSTLISSGAVARRAQDYADQVRRYSAAAGGSAADRAALLEGAANAFLFQDELRRLVQHTIARDSETQAKAAAHSSVVTMAVFSGVLFVLLVFVVALSTTVGRSIAVPLRRLTLAARQVADATERELLRVADDDLGEPDDAELVTISLQSPDEIGELAGALNRVQDRAYEMLQRQRMSQRNIAAMFASVGRRTHTMASRQLAMIDELERDETDQGLLQSLYELDHLTNRLRRSAGNLVVLSGASEPFGFGEPITIVHAVRSALAQVEDFQRIRFNTLLDLRVTPDVALPLISVIAEIMENAVSFSAPSTTVEVTASRVAEGCLITVIDSGVGMSEERLAQENARILRRERLDLMPTDMLGLFVVGRLSRQTGIKVVLGSGDEGGIAVWITVPSRYLVRSAAPASQRPTPASPPPVGAPAPTWAARRTGLPASAAADNGHPASGNALPPGRHVPAPSAGPAPAATGEQLTRRQAGTHFRHHIEQPGNDHPVAGHGPEAIRELVEQFEHGARRAQRDQETSALSGPPAQRPSPPALPGYSPYYESPPGGVGAPDFHRITQAAPAAGPAAAARGGATSEPTGARSGDSVFDDFMHDLQEEIRHLQELTPWPAFGGTRVQQPQKPSPAAPGMPTVSQGLVRRVPGASLTPDFSFASPASEAAFQYDPAAARSLVLDFEAGVARATAQGAAQPHPQERK